MFQNDFPGFTVLAYSGMPINDVRLYGRPYGDLAIVYRVSSIKLNTDHGLSINNRAEAISVESSVYFLMSIFLAELMQVYDVEVGIFVHLYRLL